jgi:hypothetical protein
MRSFDEWVLLGQHCVLLIQGSLELVFRAECNRATFHVLKY